MGAAEIVRTIVQEFPLALYGSMLVGVICAFLGVYIVARRVVFLGAVMTQVSVMGIALTFLPFFPLPHTVGSLVVTLATVVIISRLLTGKKIPRDAVLGVVFVTFKDKSERKRSTQEIVNGPGGIAAPRKKAPKTA